MFAMHAAASLTAPVTDFDVPLAADQWEDMPAVVPFMPSSATVITSAAFASSSLDEQLIMHRKQHELLQLQQQILKLQQSMDDHRAPRQQVNALSVIESMVFDSLPILHTMSRNG
ncbi:uncharacterized protein [Drosophila tropicalis]|uniref:uncharacterized protein n=1 Tax=Drosophila tropicalis TaxID=46794 RepID=UPI0035ABF674